MLAQIKHHSDKMSIAPASLAQPDVSRRNILVVSVVCLVSAG